MATYMLNQEVVPFCLDQKQRERLFNSFFVEGDETVIRLKKQALGCELQHSKLRILSWKMFLGILSTPPRAEEWIKQITQQRSQFTALKDKYANWKEMDEESDPNFNNPLSLDVTSPWSVFFENEQLRKDISQDVERLYPEYEYFQQKWVKEMMIEILFIYSKENTDVSYKQGMHELLAPVIYILDNEKMTLTEGSVLSQLMDSNYLQHDAYIIFERLMKTTGCWFKMNKDHKNPDAESPILQKCNHIYHQVLKSKDPGLYSYLTSLKIEPQLFLLRWIRILFGREFPLDETLNLWDAIFSFDKNFTLIDYIAVSMLITIKEQLLNTDQNGALVLLFKYPINLPMTSFVDHALSMAKPKPKSIPTGPTTLSTPTPKSTTSLPSPVARLPALHFPKSFPTNPLSSQNNNAAVSPRAFGESELNQLKIYHSNLAVRLEEIVNTLQLKLLPVVTDLPGCDSILLSLAELKQIKDVMSGHLPLDALPPI